MSITTEKRANEKLPFMGDYPLEDGNGCRQRRIPKLELFAQSLGREDRVALEVTGAAWEIARILEGHVRRVVVVSPDETGILRRVYSWCRFAVRGSRRCLPKR